MTKEEIEKRTQRLKSELEKEYISEEYRQKVEEKLEYLQKLYNVLFEDF